MPVVNYPQYCQMLDNAKENKFAYPAINISSSSTINATLSAFKEADSDGIIQVSTGGGKFASGQGVGSMSKGAIALALYVHAMSEQYDINIAISKPESCVNNLTLCVDSRPVNLLQSSTA